MTVDQRPFLVFELGALSELAIAPRLFALDVKHVSQVIEVESVVPVPLAPPAVEGMLTHQGRILTVIDPAILFELEAQPQPVSQLVVLRRDRGAAANMGLKAVRISGIVPWDRFEATDVEVIAAVSAVVRDGQRLIHVVDFESLVHRIALQFDIRSEGTGAGTVRGDQPSA